MKHKAVKIVGAGLFGCTLARILAEAGIKVDLIDRRNCVGGNAATYYNNGIEVHRYGCHIFHTDDDAVWAFANRFTAFNQYQHHCIAKHAGKKYFMPFNLTLLEQFFNRDFGGPDGARSFIKRRIAQDVAVAGIDLSAPRNLEEQAVTLIGHDLYEAFVRNYTIKQWNCDPKELDASIIRRLPIRYSCDVSYYDDRYQGIPVTGYGRMFDAMLDHKNIHVVFGKDYGEKDADADIAAGKLIIFTGALDELFGYRLGHLPWRSLRFKTEVLQVRDFQGNATINYVDADVSFTRIHEFKHFHTEDRSVMDSDITVI